MSNITLSQAQALLECGIEKSEELKTKMNLAIVDSGSNLVAFARMDGSFLGSIDIAIKKAKTSSQFFMNSGELGKQSTPGNPLYMIELSNEGLITFPGGVPLKNHSGDVIGAIGVSGSTVEDDHEVANACAEHLLEIL